ncbi:MAG: MopE-related protein [Myxococcota bacterium]|nr:MopE-related protein [Myxococcota bacterium]
MRALKLMSPATTRWALLSLTLAALFPTACADSRDKDGDGFRVDVDCDDDNPLRHPGRAEVCNGLDDDCDPDTWLEGEGEDYDGDGTPACADCDDQAPEVHPGAPPFCSTLDADCDGQPDGAGDALGESSRCAAADCLELLNQRPNIDDGTYWIDGDGSEGAFEVACDMTTDGGGWIHLAVSDADGVIVASRAEDNPWHKCDDDSAAYYQGLTESEIEADYFPNGNVLDIALSYVHPETGDPIHSRGLDALRPRLTELHSSSRMVATVADNDGGDWQGGGNGGLEVYIVGADGEWRLLTPGSGGDCGAGGNSWPAAGSESGFYLWASESEASAIAGDTGLEEADWALGPGEVLPISVQMAVFTGGGVSFGWEQRSFRVR